MSAAMTAADKSTPQATGQGFFHSEAAGGEEQRKAFVDYTSPITRTTKQTKQTAPQRLERTSKQKKIKRPSTTLVIK